MRRASFALPLLLLALTACGGGHRFNMLITSNPSDALVYVNDYPRGVTPVEVPYEWIGTYRVQLQHNGYQDINTLERIRKPWYYYIPFVGLVIDMLPFPDRHTVNLHYNMAPIPTAPF